MGQKTMALTTINLNGNLGQLKTVVQTISQKMDNKPLQLATIALRTTTAMAPHLTRIMLNNLLMMSAVKIRTMKLVIEEEGVDPPLRPHPRTTMTVDGTGNDNTGTTDDDGIDADRANHLHLLHPQIRPPTPLGAGDAEHKTTARFQIAF